MKEQKNRPKLRFPEFKGEWERKKLGEVAERVTTKNSIGIDNVLTISAQYGLISQLEFFNKSVSAKDVTGYYLLSKDDFAYNKSYSNGYPMGAIKRLNRYENGVVSTLYICFRNKKDFDNSFAEQYYETGNQNVEIEKVAQEGARNHGLLNIGVKDFFDIQLSIPTLPEQKRIASFFTTLDQKIAEIKQKKNLLENYKKGVMQKLFSQEMRFKDESNLNFKKWDKYKLGKIIEEYKENSVKENQHPVLTSSNKGLVLQTDYYENNRITEKSNLGFNIIPSGYITYRSRSDNKRFTFNVNDFEFKGLISTYYPVFKLIEGSNKFLIEYLNYKWEYIGIYGVGTSQAVLSFNTLKTIEIQIPCIAEQTKIANFLSAIDEKINRTENQLQQTQAYKKGLLQKMFV